MNKVINSRSLIKVNKDFIPFNDKIMRITRYPISTVQDLINLQEKSVLFGGGHIDEPVQEYFGCVNKILQTVVPVDEMKSCPESECIQFEADSDGYNSTSHSGNKLSVVCNEGYQIPFINKKSTNVKCDNGIWNGPFQCSKIICPELKPFSEKRFIDIYNYNIPAQVVPGFTTNFTCMPGYFYRGKETTEL